MIGHGSPSASPRPLSARRVRAARMAWHFIVALLCILGGTSVASAQNATMRLRMEWGGGGERLWRGKLAVSEGTLSQPRALGIEADEPGSIYAEAGTIDVRPKSRRVYDGVDFTVTAPLDAFLLVELASPEPLPEQKPGAEPVAQPAPLSLRVPLRKLAHEFESAPLDAQGNRLLVRRAPGDRLRVRLSQDSVIYEPGEVAEFEVQPHLLPMPEGTKVRIQAQLTSARGGREVFWTFDHDVVMPAESGETEPLAMPVKLPDVEGVFDLKITAQRRGLGKGLNWKPTVEERKVQLVAIARQRPANAPTAAAIGNGAAATGSPLDTVVCEIDPASPPWWERLGNASPIPGLRRGPLGNGDAAPWQHALGPLIQLGPGGKPPNNSWEAYPLPIVRPGQPHIVEVEYPTDVPQTMGLSIVEPNASGTVAPIGLDSGVYLADEEALGTAKLARHRLVFWPRTRTPLLLVTNHRDGSRAVFGKIRVLGPKPAGISPLARETGPVMLPRAFPANAKQPERLLAGYYDRPLFPENFSAPEALDPWSGRSLDDWVTFYEGATRLVQYLNYAGYNGLMISAVSDGSAIYPSALLEPTARYDTGIFFDSAQDPVRKDVLELLFRLFDREGLQLIPALQFAAPLPELEAQKRGRAQPVRLGPNGRKSDAQQNGPTREGLELVSVEGATWLTTHEPRKGLAPYYNPLNADVQTAMLGVVRELSERYARHASFAGISLQLTADGYCLLPGPDWGLDENTLSRFVQERQIRFPADARKDRQAMAKLVLSDHRAQWVDWRAHALHDFHRRVQTEVSTARGSPTKLYLAAADAFDRPDLEQALRPALPRTASLDATLQGMGIDPRLCAGQGEIMFLRPQRIAPLDSLLAQSLNLDLNDSAELDEPLRSPTGAGSLFFHEPQQTRLASFDAKSPFKGTHTLLVAQPSPAGRANRKRFIHSLATLDARVMFDGGWLLPLGQEDSLHDLVAVYRQLPAAAFETVPGKSQPITVRRLSTPQGTYVYAVNDSAWKGRLTIDVTAPAGARFESLDPSRSVPAPQGAAGQQRWTVDIEPYDLVAGRFSTSEVALARPRIALEGDVATALQSRILDLGARVTALQQPTTTVVTNPSFETQASESEPLPGWVVSDQPGSQAVLDGQQKHGGVQSVKLSSDEPVTWLVSAPFAPPKSGRIMVQVWLRVADAAHQPPLRLALGGRLNDQDYYRYALVGAGPTAKKVGTQWSPYVFPVHDLPAEGLSDLRVRFDLMGAGEVWIDDIELREFSDDELKELARLITSALYKLRNDQLSDCQRLLDGFWPRYLVSNVALERLPLTSRPRFDPPPSDAEKTTEPETKPGFMEKVRRSLPEFLR